LELQLEMLFEFYGYRPIESFFYQLAELRVVAKLLRSYFWCGARQAKDNPSVEMEGLESAKKAPLLFPPRIRNPGRFAMGNSQSPE
jgi:hypothetical protein